MYISVDPKSSTPLYVQVKEQMRMAVATGALQVGDQLPTVRELATRLLINPNTVARVYRELQAEGLLTSRQGSGTFVAAGAEPLGQAEGRRQVAEVLRRAAALAANLGMTEKQFGALAAQTLNEARTDTPEVSGDVATGD
jgi:GntR family transcriptional regulator